MQFYDAMSTGEVTQCRMRLEDYHEFLIGWDLEGVSLDQFQDTIIVFACRDSDKMHKPYDRR
jgi:hypothetical protein